MSFLEGLRPRTQNQQVLLAVALLSLLSALLVACYFLLWRQPYRVLFTDLRNTDAATIVAELDKIKVPYRLQAGGATILVPERLVDQTRLKITSEDIPLKGSVGFELFNKSDMGLTEFAQKINYQRALQGELARTIMTMDTVDTARVHLSIPDPSVFREDRRPAKASVTVVPRPGKSVPPGAVLGIQKLIAAAVPDLSVADVVVLDEHGDIVSPDAVAGPSAATPEMQEKAAVELYYSAKVREALQQRLPATSIVVAVTATKDVAAPINPPRDAQIAAPTGPRAFSLKVSVAISPFPDQQTQEELRQLASTAIGGNGAQGDAVTISPGSPVAAEPVEPASAAPPSLIAASPKPAPTLQINPMLGGLLILIVAALGGVWLVLRRRSRTTGLTSEQRDTYVRRLRALLEDTVDASSL